MGAASIHADSAPEPESTTTATTTAEAEIIARRQLHKMIAAYRREAWRWQRVMGRPLTRRLRTPPADPSERVAAWRRLAQQARVLAQHPPHRRAWLCIHRYEGAWNDPNPPYYGGLQMDVSFQRAYGRTVFRRKGTADHWTPLEQMWAAENAHRSGRGFYPWPNTARSCGLI
jgi:hypothetical protein